MHHIFIAVTVIMCQQGRSVNYVDHTSWPSLELTIYTQYTMPTLLLLSQPIHTNLVYMNAEEATPVSATLVHKRRHP